MQVNYPLFQNSRLTCSAFGVDFSFFLNIGVVNMAISKRTRDINELNSFIWSLKGKCDGITDMNKGLILQYCRFAVMSSEMSKKMEKDLDAMTEEQFDFCIKKYEKFNKIMLNLYKTLNFSTIKDELADFGNPYTKLYLEAEKDGDF